ncbi:MAG: hypothetical protein QOG65_165 [Actinomycetota bacterium]|nr:hypothetical protein [Actinomycetota bacterium]
MNGERPRASMRTAELDVKGVLNLVPFSRRLVHDRSQGSAASTTPGSRSTSAFAGTPRSLPIGRPVAEFAADSGETCDMTEAGCPGPVGRL